MTRPREMRCDVPNVALLRELTTRPLPLHLGAPHATQRFLRDTYLDTPDSQLLQFGITCRYRVRDDDRRQLTLFVPGAGGTGAGDLLRHDANVAEVDPLRAVAGESAPARRLRAVLDPATLGIGFTVRTERAIRESVRSWRQFAQFEFAYDSTAVERNGIVRSFQELRIRRRRGGPPSLARLASVLETAHGLRPILVDRLERERLIASGAARESDRRAVSTGHVVALVALDQGSIACRSEGGTLRLPIASGSGDEACRHLLRECFGSAVGELRLLSELPAGDGRPPLEVWLATQIRVGRRTPSGENLLWLSFEDIIARAGTSSLSDPQTVAALFVAARSDLPTLARTGASGRSGETAAQAPRVVEAEDGPPAVQDRLLDAERSLLEFNGRVLAMAEDAQTPLLERLQYLAIVNANLDEFFAVSVTALKRARLTMTDPGKAARAEAHLAALAVHVRELLARQERCVAACLTALARLGIHLVPWSDLTTDEIRKLKAHFRDVVFSALTPQAVTEAPGYPTPVVPSTVPSFAVVVKDPQTGPTHLAYVRVPALLNRLIPVRDGRAFVLLEELISHEMDTLYRGREVLQAYSFRVTRSGELDVDEATAGDLLQAIEEDARRRISNAVVRVEVDRRMPASLRSALLREMRFDGGEQVLPLGDDDVYELGDPFDATVLKELASLPFPELRFPPFRPRVAFTPDRPMFDLVRERDRLVHHPYDDFASSVQRFVEEAADDPAVTTIKLTLYRAGERSPIVDALVRAAKGGKDVTAFVELKARFDEERNVRWARRLADAGIHVVHGLVGLKNHAKVALVVRHENEALRRYVHLGTGNYNGTTARFYTDVGLFSADETLAADVSELFNELTGSSRGPSGLYQRLLVAPHAALPGLLARVDREAEHARAGRASGIRLKLNGLSDEAMIEALYRASQAGVPIELIVRGICRLRPGVAGLSETIRVVSLLGRFLEHARIYRFANGGEPEYFIASADWRPRNLRRRIETVAPVADAACRARLDTILDRELADGSAWTLLSDGGYGRDASASDVTLHAQTVFAAESERGAELAPA